LFARISVNSVGNRVGHQIENNSVRRKASSGRAKFWPCDFFRIVFGLRAQPLSNGIGNSGAIHFKSFGAGTMNPTPTEEPAEPEVSEEFASAWASVLLDIHEKTQSPVEPTTTPKAEEASCPST
jgi:hypothetical protein